MPPVMRLERGTPKRMREQFQEYTRPYLPSPP